MLIKGNKIPFSKEEMRAAFVPLEVARKRWNREKYKGIIAEHIETI